MTRSLLRAESSLTEDDFADAAGFLEEGLEGVEGEHDGGVAEGFFWLGVSFEEEAVGACGHGGEGEGEGHFTVAAAAVSLTAGLHY